MREVFKKSIWVVAIFVATGLMFAGCAGDPGSSSSSSFSRSTEDDPTPIGGDNPSWLVQVDPEGASIDITPITLGGATASPSGLFDLSNDGACGWAAGPETLTCDMTLTNLTGNTITYTTRVTVKNGSCIGIDCAVATLNNADYPSPGAQLIDGASAGICYTENGGDHNIIVPNPEGCSVEYFNVTDQYAISMLLPGGGNQTETWVFGGTSAKYNFIMEAWGSTFAPNDPGQDTRYNLTDYSTWVLKFYDGDNLNGAYCGLGRAGTGGWQKGTPWCSSETDVDNVAAGSKVYLNMMAEYADRIEQSIADTWNAWDGCPSGTFSLCTGFPNNDTYEYYGVAQIEVGYDPAVLSHAGASTAIKRNACINSAPVVCATHPENYQIEAWAEDVQYTIAGDSRINTLQSRSQNFTAATPAAWWYNQEIKTTLAGANKCWLTSLQWWPHHAAQSGVVDFTGGATGCAGAGCPTCNMVGSVDTDTDFWFGFIEMTVNGASGDYSPVKLIQSNNSTFQIYWSSNTADGGPTGGDDINGGGTSGWCYSPNGGETFFDDCAGTPCCNVLPLQACTGSPNNVVSRGLERTNCDLPPSRAMSRSDCPGGVGTCGGKQGFNTYIAVQ
jgi:hypothetical protein